MSSASFDSEEFRREHERRRHPRLRLRSLAYVDVDADNGGILLNLSESGLALQAVAPFSGPARVTLRIQPPKPRKRLDLNAEITWLSGSKKEAGLQFLELADDMRMEIANWISAEGGAPEPRATAGSATAPTTQVSPAHFPEEAPTPGRRWTRSPEYSPSNQAPPIQLPSHPKPPTELPAPSIGSANLDLHISAILRELPVDIAAQNSAPNIEQIPAPITGPIERTVEPIAFSEQVSPAAPSPSLELPHPVAEPPRRRKWAFFLENSPSRELPPDQKTPCEIPRPAVGSTYVERLTDAILRANWIDVSPKNPIATNEEIHARTDTPAEHPSDQIVFSEKVSAAAAPSVELPPPPAAPAIASPAHALQPPPATVAPPTAQAAAASAAGFIATRDPIPKTSIPATSEDFPRSSERRRLPRQRIGSLAYLDIGSDNGGMVLDLNEDGLALQAFNPLIDQTRLSLRIQPPKSRRRIVATAEISWLSDSKTEAGLKFIELSEDARTEIADWLSAETGVAEPPPVDDAPLCETPQVSSASPPPPSDSERRHRVWEEWFPLFGDLKPDESGANQKAFDDFLKTRADGDDSASQPSSARTEKFSERPEKYPESYPPATEPRSSQVTEAPVSSATFSGSVSKVRRPALKSPPRLPAPARPFPSEQFRKWGTIAVVCACVALVFLFLGMTISRVLLSDRATRLSAEENARDAAASSPALTTSATPETPGKIDAPAARGTALSEVSASKTRPADPENVSRVTHAEIRATHGSENSESRRTGGEADPIALALPPAMVPETETAKSGSQNLVVPSLPVWSVQAAGNHNPTAGTPTTNPVPARVAERRSDCYLLYRVEPLYPRQAREQRIEGTVMVRLQIGTDGRIKASRELSGPALLVPAALAAVREWRFIPSLLNGQPVDSEKDVSIEFKLSR